MVKRKILGRCPACGSNLEVTRFQCFECDTAIEGRERQDEWRSL